MEEIENKSNDVALSEMSETKSINQEQLEFKNNYESFTDNHSEEDNNNNNINDDKITDEKDVNLNNQDDLDDDIYNNNKYNEDEDNDEDDDDDDNDNNLDDDNDNIYNKSDEFKLPEVDWDNLEAKLKQAQLEINKQVINKLLFFLIFI